jgi:hypothetical protein
VTIQQAAARALTSVQRARALFGTSPSAPPHALGLDTAAQSLASTGQRTQGLAGDAVDHHHQFVGAATQVLNRDADTDTTLNHHLSAAAALTQNGGRRLDSIVERTRALAATASTARTPAAQRALLQALHTQVSEANAVIDSTRQQATGIAGKISSLDYQSGKQGNGGIHNADFAEDVGPKPNPQPGDPSDEAARKYAQTQRAADQALVDQANRDGRTQYLPSMIGQPGYMTQEQADAAARLRDYRTLTDPNSHIALHGGPDARKYAGQRLNDFNTSKMIGPLARDTVLGGDARSRAQARLQMQRDLENGNLSWSQQPLTPDDATRVLDQAEAADRANVLNRLQQQLVACGVSPGAAQQIADGYAHGVIPSQYVDAASAAGKVFDGGKSGFERYPDWVPTGQHWQPGIAFTPQDIEALNKIGSRFGMAGTALSLGTGLYEVFGQGKDAGEVLSKAAGGWAGAWGGAELGGGLGSFGGPVGAFLGALGGSVLGAFGGDWAGSHAYQWVTN